MLDEQTLRKAALECFINAQSLHKEARLLADHGFRPRGAALAIIGLEEFAKAITYTLAALLPAKRDSLIKELNNHAVKHLISASAEAAEIETEDYRLVLSEDSGFPLSAEERLQILFRWLLQHDVSSIAVDRKGARDFFESLRTQGSHFLPEPHLKNAALYVDIGPEGEVLTPNRAEDQAESEILGLEWFLDIYQALPKVLEDDGAWGSFADRICTR
jgi:AbiV family abortive infection protein